MVRAYLDAGSASMLLQLVLGGVASIAVGMKLYWGRLMRLLRIRKPEPEAAEPVQAAPAEPVEANGSPASERAPDHAVAESRGR